ncbi:MAG: hypothetical protein JRJ38_16590 [Deltaproteobacteria bacterium]|nr:hypothetical protein [Deltaproteobacteria bacterium]
MENKAYQDLLTQREATVMFNKGVKCALYILEKVETLTLEGRMHLHMELKKEIAESVDDLMRFASYGIGFFSSLTKG